MPSGSGLAAENLVELVFVDQLGLIGGIGPEIAGEPAVVGLEFQAQVVFLVDVVEHAQDAADLVGAFVVALQIAQYLMPEGQLGLSLFLEIVNEVGLDPVAPVKLPVFGDPEGIGVGRFPGDEENIPDTQGSAASHRGKGGQAGVMADIIVGADIDRIGIVEMKVGREVVIQGDPAVALVGVYLDSGGDAKDEYLGFIDFGTIIVGAVGSFDNDQRPDFDFGLGGFHSCTEREGHGQDRQKEGDG